MTAALGNIDILKKQFNEDRTEYEGYVDHIKLLSQGREELILEYEAENKELRQDIEDLAQQLASKKWRHALLSDWLLLPVLYCIQVFI